MLEFCLEWDFSCFPFFSWSCIGGLLVQIVLWFCSFIYKFLFLIPKRYLYHAVSACMLNYAYKVGTQFVSKWKKSLAMVNYHNIIRIPYSFDEALFFTPFPFGWYPGLGNLRWRKLYQLSGNIINFILSLRVYIIERG